MIKKIINFFRKPFNNSKEKKYLVGLLIGGTQEEPYFKMLNIQTIYAKNPLSAEKIYNEKNDCTWCYGMCLGEVIKDIGLVIDKRNETILSRIEDYRFFDCD
ncbi:MAG: hypothetical protein GX638_06905 [Crenarchaeota archaeon]|nr:hypothetical protein [Thermoproteota archaeon]